MKLQEQINKVKDSEMETELKTDRIRMLQEQIAQIDLRIAEKRQEQMQKISEREPGQRKVDSTTAEPGSTDQDLIRLSLSMSGMQRAKMLENKLEANESGIRAKEGEIRLERIRLSESDPRLAGNAERTTLEKKREEIVELTRKNRYIQKKAQETYKDVRETYEHIRKKRSLETGAADVQEEGALRSGANG